MRNKKKLMYIDKNGYKRYCDSDKLVHRHVAEMMLGRKLIKGETVHHKNRSKLDNRRLNLWVFESQQRHYQIHKKDEKTVGVYGQEATFSYYPYEFQWVVVEFENKRVVRVLRRGFFDERLLE